LTLLLSALASSEPQLEWDTLVMATTPSEPRPALGRPLARSDHRRPSVATLLLAGTLIVLLTAAWAVVSLTGDAATSPVETGADVAARPLIDDGDARIVGSSTCRGVGIGPRESIQRDIRTNPPGTTFCLRAGVHRIRAPLVPKNDQQFVGERGAILSGARVLSLSKVGAYWVATGQTQESSPAGLCLPTTYTGCQYAEDVFFDDRNLWQVTSLSELSPGEFFFDYGADTIYLANDPSGHVVETSVTPTSFDARTATGVEIRGLVVEKFANPAQTPALQLGFSWVAAGNEVRLNHGIGIASGSRSVVRGNYVHDQGQMGLAGYEASHALVVKNEVSYNNTEGFDAWWEAGGSKWVRTTHLTVRGNYVHDNEGNGLWTDIDNIDTLYEHNRVIGNTGVGIFHEISYHAVIRRNYVARNALSNDWIDGAGILVADSPDVRVYGNIVFRNGGGIGLKQSDRGSGEYGPYVVKNAYVHDNVITMCKGWTGAAHTGDVDSSIYDRNNRFENNTYRIDARSSKRWIWEDSERTWSEWKDYGNDLGGSLRVINC
jgi:hypothetical protein